MYSVKKIVQVIKSITAREVFQRCSQVKKRLWGEEFWSDGYFASTVGKHGDEAKIGKYVQSQGQTYKKLHEDRQLTRISHTRFECCIIAFNHIAASC